MAKQKGKSKKDVEKATQETVQKEVSSAEILATPTTQSQKSKPVLFPNGGLFPSSLTKPLEKLNERVHELEELVKSLIGTKP